MQLRDLLALQIPASLRRLDVDGGVHLRTQGVSDGSDIQSMELKQSLLPVGLQEIHLHFCSGSKPNLFELRDADRLYELQFSTSLRQLQLIVRLRQGARLDWAVCGASGDSADAWHSSVAPVRDHPAGT
jgi:hypothetical protein